MESYINQYTMYIAYVENFILIHVHSMYLDKVKAMQIH